MNEHSRIFYDGTLADINGDHDLDLITLNNAVPLSLSLWENISTNEGTTLHFDQPTPELKG